MRISVFASGGGSNFEAIVHATQTGNLRATVALCVTDRVSAGVLDRAQRHSIPTTVLSPNSFEESGAFDEALLALVEEYQIDLIALAGYLKKIPDNLVDSFRGRITNIHPALLPSFGGKGMYGLNVHRAVLDSGETESGATVHLVDFEYDTGRILMQDRVPVLADDTPESLAARVLEVEHRIYPETLARIAAGSLNTTLI